MMNSIQMKNHKEIMAKSIMYHSKFKGRFIPTLKVIRLINELIDMMIVQTELHYKKGYNIGREEKFVERKKQRIAENTTKNKISTKGLKEVMLEQGSNGFRSKSIHSLLRDL